MIINNNIQAMAGMYTNWSITQGKNAYGGKASPSKRDADQVVLSGHGVGLNNALRRLKSSQGDVRADLVEKFSALINNGNYHVDSEAIAEKMLGSQV